MLLQVARVHGVEGPGAGEDRLQVRGELAGGSAHGALYRTVPYCTVLYCTVLYCTVLQVGPHTVFLSKKMKELTEASSRPASSPASSTRPAYERTKASITHLHITHSSRDVNQRTLANFHS